MMNHLQHNHHRPYGDNKTMNTFLSLPSASHSPSSCSIIRRRRPSSPWMDMNDHRATATTNNNNNGTTYHHSSCSPSSSSPPIAMEIRGRYWPRIVLTGPAEDLELVSTGCNGTSGGTNKQNNKNKKSDRSSTAATTVSSSKTAVKVIKIPRRGLKHVDKRTKMLLAKATRPTTVTITSSSPSPVPNSNVGDRRDDQTHRLVTPPSFVVNTATTAATATNDNTNGAFVAAAGTPLTLYWPYRSTSPINQSTTNNNNNNNGHSSHGRQRPRTSSFTGKVVMVDVPSPSAQAAPTVPIGSQLVPTTASNTNNKRRKKTSHGNHQTKPTITTTISATGSTVKKNRTKKATE